MSYLNNPALLLKISLLCARMLFARRRTLVMHFYVIKAALIVEGFLNLRVLAKLPGTRKVVFSSTN